jgi:hypothetical protein
MLNHFTSVTWETVITDYKNRINSQDFEDVSKEVKIERKFKSSRKHRQLKKSQNGCLPPRNSSGCKNRTIRCEEINYSGTAVQ